MKILSLKNPAKVLKYKRVLENKLSVKLEFDKADKNNLKIIGKEVNIYDAEGVIQAIDFGFALDTALFLKSEDFMFEVLDLKDYTRRNDLKEVRARVIGKKGKAINTLMKLTNSDIILRENHIGIITRAEDMEAVTTALCNLIKGSKHSNVYSFLERGNQIKKKRKVIEGVDLGLKGEGK